MIDFKNKKIVVMGLGLNQGGLGVAQWLLRHKFPIIVTDLKSSAELKKTLARLPQTSLLTLRLGEHREADFRSADIVIQNPSVPNNSRFIKLARQNKALIINEAVLFFDQCKSKKIIGVTGTRGKSSTSWILYQLLKAGKKRVHITGNIAKNSMMQVVDSIRPNDWVVVELSSWHLEKLPIYKQAPHIALLTNIYRDHLNRYANFAAYGKAKSLITAYQTESDIFITNHHQKITQSIAARTAAKTYFYRPLPKALAKSTTLKGPHNEENISLAIAAAHLVGIKPTTIRRTLPKLKGLPYRQELVGQKAGRQFINDSAATSPDAVSAAITRYGADNVVLIAGGVDKDLDFKTLAQSIMLHQIRLVTLPGSATDKLVAALGRYSMSKAQSLRQAVHSAWRLSRPGDVILLSPGAASFNLFKNEFDRGDQFKKIVNEICQKKK